MVCSIVKRLLRSRRGVIAAALALVIVGSAGIYVSRAPRYREVAFSDFVLAIERGEIAGIRATATAVQADLKSGGALRASVPDGYFAANSDLIASLARQGVRVEVARTDSRIFNVGAALFAFGVLGLVGFTAWRTTSGRVPSVSGRSKVADQGENPVTFDDVAGVDEAKEELREIVDFLREPERFARLGGRIPRGVP